jgi:NAD(P)-dependent dehydrogenase (short-subunit alcohol dehydrogenase family)
MKEGAAFVGITTHSLELGTIERNIGAYLAAKHALRALLRTLSHELEVRKIRVNAVAPKFMPGGLNAGLPDGVKTLLSRQSDGSTLYADAVAEVVADICISPSTFPPSTSIAIPSKTIAPL